jgi:hypothetical protein
MQPNLDIAETVILILNLILGLGIAIPLSRYFANIQGLSMKQWQIYFILLGVYFIESVAFAAGMATNIFSIALSVFWGIILGVKVSKLATVPQKLIKAVLLFSLYTSLPAISFLSIPLIMALAGWSIFSTASGLNFGIPTFVPWPVNTIFGLSILVTFSALIFKTGITTGLVGLKLRTQNKQ